MWAYEKGRCLFLQEELYRKTIDFHFFLCYKTAYLRRVYIGANSLLIFEETLCIAYAPYALHMHIMYSICTLTRAEHSILFWF
jgi:hypothetical protein